MTIASQRKTTIIEERVRAMHERIPIRAKALNEDGHLPGTILLPAQPRLMKYRAVISFPDAIKCLNPNWEDDIRRGIDPVGPESPYLINLLRVPGLFKQVTADYMALEKRDAEKQLGGSNAVAQSPEQSPVAAGGGLPLPMAPALGPPQPAAGGGAGSYGAP